MGFRPDLDLSGILTAFDKHLRPDQEEKATVVNVEEPGGLRFPRPMRFGAGPDVWSSCTEVAVPVKIRWDVNGYYAALGVSPLANRRELREAYQALDGQSSSYLTYVFKQLLDPEVRAAYDASPLGEPFLDELTQRDMRRRAEKEAHQRTFSTGEFTTVDQVMDEWGYVLLNEDQGVDSVSPMGQDLHHKDEPRSTKRNDRLQYSYYAWNTTGYLPDEKLLQQWQEVLTTTATKLGISPKLSFGITGVSDHSHILETVGKRVVIFFPEGEEPTDSVARQAIEEFTQFPQNSRRDGAP